MQWPGNVGTGRPRMASPCGAFLRAQCDYLPFFVYETQSP
jgi:hypothetical protein